MRIGEVARRTGLAASTIRYYEKEALLEPPARTSGQRRYASDVLGRIAVLTLALRAGFTVAETRLFISGFSAQARPAERWRELARRKLAELDAELSQIAAMKVLLEASFHCECPSLDVCEALILQRQRDRGGTAKAGILLKSGRKRRSRGRPSPPDNSLGDELDAPSRRGADRSD